MLESDGGWIRIRLYPPGGRCHLLGPVRYHQANAGFPGESRQPSHNDVYYENPHVFFSLAVNGVPVDCSPEVASLHQGVAKLHGGPRTDHAQPHLFHGLVPVRIAHKFSSFAPASLEGRKLFLDRRRVCRRRRAGPPDTVAHTRFWAG